MPHIALALLLSLSLAGDSGNVCDLGSVPKDPQGCVSYKDFVTLVECPVMPKCFVLHVIDTQGKVYFVKYPERQRITTALDASIEVLYRNPKLKGISIILFDKTGKMTELQKDAEAYMMDKGIDKKRFTIKIINKVQ